MLTLLDVSNKHMSYSRCDLRVIVCWPTLRQTQYARILLAAFSASNGAWPSSVKDFILMN